MLLVGCNTCKIMAVGLAADLIRQCFALCFAVEYLCDCAVLSGKQRQVHVCPWCTHGPFTTCEEFKWKSNILFYIAYILFYFTSSSIPFSWRVSLYVFLPQVFGSCFYELSVSPSLNLVGFLNIRTALEFALASMYLS